MAISMPKLRESWTSRTLSSRLRPAPRSSRRAVASSRRRRTRPRAAIPSSARLAARRWSSGEAVLLVEDGDHERDGGCLRFGHGGQGRHRMLATVPVTATATRRRAGRPSVRAPARPAGAGRRARLRAALARARRARAGPRAHAVGLRLPLVGRAVDGRAPGGRAATRLQLRAGRRGPAVPAVPAVRARAAARRAAVEPAPDGRAAVRGQRQSALFSPFTWPRCCCRSGGRSARGGPEGVRRGVRDVPARARAGDALRRARCWPGSSTRSGCTSWSGSRGRCRACGRGCRGCCCSCDRVVRRPSRAAGRGARARRRAAVLRRPPGVELPRAGRRGSFSPCWRSRGSSAARGRARSGGWRPGWWRARCSPRSRCCRSSSCCAARATSRTRGQDGRSLRRSRR